MQLDIVLTDESRARSMGERGRRRVCEEYLVPRRRVRELALVEQLLFG